MLHARGYRPRSSAPKIYQRLKSIYSLDTKIKSSDENCWLYTTHEHKMNSNGESSWNSEVGIHSWAGYPDHHSFQLAAMRGTCIPMSWRHSIIRAPSRADDWHRHSDWLTRHCVQNSLNRISNKNDQVSAILVSEFAERRFLGFSRNKPRITPDSSNEILLVTK